LTVHIDCAIGMVWYYWLLNISVKLLTSLVESTGSVITLSVVISAVTD